MKHGELNRARPSDRPLNVDALIQRVRRRHDERAAALGQEWNDRLAELNALDERRASEREVRR